MEAEETRRKLKEAIEKKKALELERQLREIQRQNKDAERELHPTGFQKVFGAARKVDGAMIKFSAKNAKATKELGKELLKANTISEKDFPLAPKKRANKLIWG